MQHNLLQYGVAACITFAAVISDSVGHDLRPSEHGLANQRDDSSPAHRDGDKQNMLSFFGSSMPLPEAQTVGGGGRGGGAWSSVHRSRDRRSNRVRLGLLAVAAICGFAGVALLVVGVIYHLRRRREKAGVERLSLNSEVHGKELVAQA